MFRLDSVSKSYGNEHALCEVSLDIKQGDTTVLLGPSGCGKSTVFELLTGLLKPDAGTVYFREKDIECGSIRELRQRIGYVIQDGGLFPHLSGGANVSLMATHLGWSKSRITSRIDELLELARLPAGVLARYPAEMSGGERQRVCARPGTDARRGCFVTRRTVGGPGPNRSRRASAGIGCDLPQAWQDRHPHHP